MEFGGNEQVKSDPIWIIAARNNQKESRVTYRINGERVSKDEFDLYKKHL